MFKVIAAYKVYDIEAEIEAGDKKYSGHYSLIMAIDSNRCFGFDFNKCYRDGEDDFHLLLIKTTGKNNLIGKIRMFFPFFRAFFIGFKEEYHSKNIDFMPVSDVKIELKKEQIFCIDGEKREKSGTLSISKTELLPKFFVLSKK